MFLNDEQQQLASDIAERLIARGETVAVAESTTGGLVSAALLGVAGASRYYAGGGVLYTLNSRTALAGVPAETYANYRGTTPEMLGALAEAMRERLGATWRIAEPGAAGAGRNRFGVPAAGPAGRRAGPP
ncbi:MAG: CinA family protein, partial [Chloroflexi bacterium]|nr:CinA family protein [Chloroflexota bacterium]